MSVLSQEKGGSGQVGLEFYQEIFKMLPHEVAVSVQVLMVCLLKGRGHDV